MGSQEYPRIAEYFVVAGLTETSQQLEDDLALTSTNIKLVDNKKDPITDICVIDRTHEESCPQGFTCVEKTPGGYPADLNHGSLTSHNMLLCYKRGKDKPPLMELGVLYESLETVKPGITVIKTTPAGRSANVNNKNGIGNHPIFLTYRRADESAPQNSLVVTDICIILSTKGERAPYAFCIIDKNLNKGLIGSNIYLCYKKSMRQVDSISYKAGIIDRYPREDVGSFSLPSSVPLFCLPMGATIEWWSSKTKHPLPVVSSFVLTTETSEKIFGSVVSFYENYPEEKLTDDMKYKLGLLRGDGFPSQITGSIHTNKAICLLSRWPMFTNFRDFLIYLYRMTVSPKPHAVPIERYISQFLYKIPFPSSQRPRVQYQMSAFSQTILTRPQITPIPLSGASFLALLDNMGPDNTITLLVLALTERKIVIHSLIRAEITRVAEALITLMFPFKWQCTYVPLCPLEMGYVMEAPCPFIVGVDSRYFDHFEPPPDVACVNLDMKSITVMDEELHQVTWKLLPKKPIKVLRATLQRCYKELSKYPREESIGSTSSVKDPDLSRRERHDALERSIQEAVLKMMAVSMKGYRQFLLPITKAPVEGTTDPNSLFNIQEFIRSREKTSHRFFTMLSGTQLFSSFIEERSLTSVLGGGEVAAGRSSSLVFFDECIDRLIPDYDSIHLIEGDDSMKSEHTVMIMGPDETGLPPGTEFLYTTFPQLQDELFSLDVLVQNEVSASRDSVRSRRASDTFTFGRRTKQEVRTMQKVARKDFGDPKMWARLLFSHTYGAWFACLPAFVVECRNKAAALRTAHDALYRLEEKNCFPLPDETYYRMLMHLCTTYNKPALAIRVFGFIRKTGTQLSAITYGLYNKAVLEGTWPSSKNDGYMLWRKLRNCIVAVAQFRKGIKANADTVSRASNDSSQAGNEERFGRDGSGTSTPRLKKTRSDRKYRDDDFTSAGAHDHGYNSMPKSEVRRGSPPPSQSSPFNNRLTMDGKGMHKRSNSSGTETTTDSVISSTDPNETPKSINLERNSSVRSVQPPNTLDIPSNCETGPLLGSFSADLGMRSDDTLVNGETENETQLSIEDQFIPHRPRATQLTPQHQRPNRSWTKVSAGGDADVLSSAPNPPHIEDNVFTGKNYGTSEANKETEKEMTPKKRSLTDFNKSPNLLHSPATPEIASFFKSDSKFISSLSDSDQRRYQELSRRPSSLEEESSYNRSNKRPSQLISPSYAYLRYRSSSALPGSGRISPLIGRSSLSDKTNLNSPSSPRGNFDDMTAEDITTLKRSDGKNSGTNRIKPRSLSESPNRRSNRKIAGGSISLGIDGVPMLASTPLRPLVEPTDTSNPKSIPNQEENEDKILSPTKSSIVSSPQTGSKKEVPREDISHLSEDPLSPSAKSPTLSLEPSPDLDPLSLFASINEKKSHSLNSKTSNLNRHLVDEILKQDLIVRSSSDATLHRDQRQRLGKSNENVQIENSNRQRKSSLPSESPEAPRKSRPPPLQRSMTCQDNITSHTSNNWFNSKSKFNSLLKATTVGMANKAKKVAKGLNETMQANIDYYLPEKIRGSLSDLSIRSSQEDLLSKGSSDVSDGRKRVDRGSQSSLQSGDSYESYQETRSYTLDQVPRRVGGTPNISKLDRPRSVPHLSASNPRLPPLSHSSSLNIPEAIGSSSDLNITASSSSLNTKALNDIEVTISSCSQCPKCDSFVYDEEIMAGWFGDDSNLNTHCPFCNSTFVPFLDIEITDHRLVDRISLASQSTSRHLSASSEPHVAAYEASFTLVGSPNQSNNPSSPSPCSAAGEPCPTSPTPSSPLNVDMSKGDGPHNNKLSSKTNLIPPPILINKIDDESKEQKENSTDNQSEGPNSPRCLEPITVPYLSSLVLRKELESLLENEGTLVLTQPHFVDHHPIIFWNLIWYFRRLNLNSNLYDLIPKSQLLEPNSKSLLDEGASSKCHVAIHLMWDNLKLHRKAVKPSLYYAWLQIVSGSEPDDDFAYSVSFLDSIINSVRSGDVRGPLVAVLNELQTQRGGARRSAYREILYLVLVAFGKDTNAFDRQYKKAFDALTTSDLEMTHICDRPPTNHTIEVRKIFGELALIK